MEAQIHETTDQTKAPWVFVAVKHDRESGDWKDRCMKYDPSELEGVAMNWIMSGYKVTLYKIRGLPKGMQITS